MLFHVFEIAVNRFIEILNGNLGGEERAQRKVEVGEMRKPAHKPIVRAALPVVVVDDYLCEVKHLRCFGAEHGYAAFREVIAIVVIKAFEVFERLLAVLFSFALGAEGGYDFDNELYRNAEILKDVLHRVVKLSLTGFLLLHRKW